MVPGHHSRVAKHPKIIEIIQIIVLLFELYILKHIIFILKPIICCFSKNLSPFYYTLLYALYILFIYSSITNSSCLLFLSTVLSDEDTAPSYGPTKSRWWARSASRHANPPNPSASFIFHSGSSTCYCAASACLHSRHCSKLLTIIHNVCFYTIRIFSNWLYYINYFD